MSAINMIRSWLKRQGDMIWKKVSKATYEDTGLSLLAIAMFSYVRNLIFNWRTPDVVRFDVEILTWLFLWFVLLTAVRETRLYVKRRSELSEQHVLLSKFLVKQIKDHPKTNICPDDLVKGVIDALESEATRVVEKIDEVTSTD